VAADKSQFSVHDLLQVTKIVGKRKNAVTYMFRSSFPLYGVSVQLFETPCEWLFD